MNTVNNESLEINKVLIDGLKKSIYDDIKDRLLKGEDYEIPGVGIIKPNFRRVKAQNKDNFAIVIKIKQDKEFKKQVRDSYISNSRKFSKL